MAMNVADVERAINVPVDQWGGRCHEISLSIVRNMYAPGVARVARGWCQGVPAQHSWVMLGNPYDPDTPILDATRWSYVAEDPYVWTGTLKNERHRPHGAGSIWEWGRPPEATGEPITLTPRVPWSREAEDFLRLLGPLDRAGWTMLAHAPVEGWPAGEFIDALCESGFEGYVPIDIVGMTTNRNPSGLYLREAS